eukprot:Phypoly_transcript_05119.p1 GENE.Phypoly_transcript_05119~~Phypoly_transcript_05119.p1  ORF type:complete len:599 (+),score=47.52 Phypoly_transcript_05119:245-1798(+)
MTNYINFTLPHRVHPSIPHYRSFCAYRALKQQWGEYFLEIKVDWDLMLQLLYCTVKQEGYAPFSHPPLLVQKDTEDSHGGYKIAHSRQGLPEWLCQAWALLISLNPIHFWGVLVGPNLLTLYGFLYITPTMNTKIFTFLFFLASQFGMTAGYHRLFAHKAFRVRDPTKLILILLGTACMQRSVLWWVRDHRAHHKYTDTDKDPYNATRGFWYSHIGWLLVKSEPAESSRLPVPMDDLNHDPMLVWQYKYYVPISILVAFVFPISVCCLWGDFWGGVFYATALRVLAAHEVTFFVNSLAHYWGDMPFADEHTPRDNMIVAILTCGEGYHNFHHEFPFDYRNTTKFYQFDTAKWVIAGLSYIGQTYDLKRAPNRLISMSKYQMVQKEMSKMVNKFDLEMPSENLTTISRASFDSLIAQGVKTIIIKALVYDVSDFFMEHPGGTKILEQFYGKDATDAFNGGVYKHSNAARNILQQYIIGICASEDDWTDTHKEVPTNYMFRFYMLTSIPTQRATFYNNT